MILVERNKEDYIIANRAELKVLEKEYIFLTARY